MKSWFKEKQSEISTEAYKILQETIVRLRDSREPIDEYFVNLNGAGRCPEDVEFLNEVRIAIDTLLNDFLAI